MQEKLDAGGTPADPGFAARSHRRALPKGRWYYRGYTPHFDGGEVAQNITFRLHDTLPKKVLMEWEAELTRLPAQRQVPERRKRLEQLLDSGIGACYLKRPEIAELLSSTVEYFDGERYRLHAWVIMPNHVHVLMTPLADHDLPAIIHSRKSYSAKKVNRLLGRSGSFWQEDYFDRAIRDERHFKAVCA